MSRTDIDAATLARSLRLMAGDGSMEWVTGPMQASVLLDIADLLDDNDRLRELAQRTAKRVITSNADTDHATGHCECGACGGAIDFFDTYCRHCGTKLEEDE